MKFPFLEFWSRLIAKFRDITYKSTKIGYSEN